MIIWDEKNKEHFIRIKGKEKVRIKASDFQVVGTNKEIEDDIKMVVDTKISDEDYHIYFDLRSKNLFDYTIWLGPVGTEPF